MKALVGQELGVSDWLVITQERINTFAETSGDHQWIHVDVERCKTDMPDGGIRMTYQWTVEIEGKDRPACVAETMSIAYAA